MINTGDNNRLQESASVSRHGGNEGRREKEEKENKIEKINQLLNEFSLNRNQEVSPEEFFNMIMSLLE